VSGKANHVATAIELLVAERFVERLPGPNRSASYRSLAPYREATERPENALPSDLIDEDAAAIFDDPVVP